MIVKTNNIKYGKKEISYELIFQDRKTLGIKVFPEGSVKVYAPSDISNDKWLITHLRNSLYQIMFSYNMCCAC